MAAAGSPDVQRLAAAGSACGQQPTAAPASSAGRQQHAEHRGAPVAVLASSRRLMLAKAVASWRVSPAATPARASAGLAITGSSRRPAGLCQHVGEWVGG